LVLFLVAPAHAAIRATNDPGAELFTNDVVRQISITIPEEGLAMLRTNARTDVLAVVREGTQVFQRVAIHLKGSAGSFRKIDDKPGLTLAFDKFTPGERFHGLSKIHLNNSVEDASYMNELIGSEAFLRAGIPAARAAYALVEINGRKLGLYVLKEGFTEQFLGRHFLHPTGSLYDPERGRDVDELLDRQLGSGAEGHELEALTAAAQEPDLRQRWLKLNRILDVERFITFMAMEILTGHRDGYSLARNNYRVYHDVDTGRMVFFPHGMDQLFGYAKLPVHPRMNGLVARAIMEMPEGRQGYRERCAGILTNILILSSLTGRVDRTAAALQSALPAAEGAALAREVSALKDRIAQRLADAQQQLGQAPLELLRFHDSMANLPNWLPVDVPVGGELLRTTSDDAQPVLAIRAGPVTFASWRSKLILPPGRYRFEGKLRTVDIAPLAFGRNHGAALRVANVGMANVPRWTNTKGWEQAAVTFAITEPEREIDLICELRAERGQAFFALDSLRLVRLK
jgi:hypothetical protein